MLIQVIGKSRERETADLKVLSITMDEGRNILNEMNLSKADGLIRDAGGFVIMEFVQIYARYLVLESLKP